MAVRKGFGFEDIEEGELLIAYRKGEDLWGVAYKEPFDWGDIAYMVKRAVKNVRNEKGRIQERKE